MTKRRIKRRRSPPEYVRACAARKWRRKLSKLAAVLQCKFTPVLVAMKKNAHNQSNAVSFAACNYTLTGSELCLFKYLSQYSQEKIDKFEVSRTFLCVFNRRSRVLVLVGC